MFAWVLNHANHGAQQQGKAKEIGLMQWTFHRRNPVTASLVPRTKTAQYAECWVEAGWR